MFSYTSAISEKWLAIVFHGLKLGNTRNPFGHSFRHPSATLCKKCAVYATFEMFPEAMIVRERLVWPD